MIIKENTISVEYRNIYSIQNQKIDIPIFQRFYAWKEKEIIQFKEDFLSVMNDKNSQFYLLDFIYYEENGVIKLADGQQRIVTLNNLIKAIKYVSQKEGLAIQEIELFNISYEVVVNQQKYKNHMERTEVAPFRKVYLDLKKFVEDNKTRINEMINVIKNKIFVYMKKCSNADDAFTIFQQINTGGKPLSKDDVIKTALDQYSKAYEIDFDTSKIKEVKQKIISFYKATMPTFDKKFDNMEIITFLRDNVTKDKETFKNFVKIIEKLSNIQKHQLKYVIEYINRSTLLDVLNILVMKNIVLDGNSAYEKDVIIPLCMISIVLTMNGGSPTEFKYLLKEVIEKIKDNKTAQQILMYITSYINERPTIFTISKEDFINKLGDNTINRNIKKALLIIDVILKNTSGSLNAKVINLEHIYPQNPHHTWAVNGWPTNKEQQMKLIDNIGNYLLLNANVNKSIQNKYITEKIAQYENIIERDIFLKTPLNTVDFTKFKNEQKDYIIKRQKNIADGIINSFPLGRVLIKD